MFTPGQIRAARALLGWSANDLATRAGVHVTTVQRMEQRNEHARGSVATLVKVIKAFEDEGIEFLDEDGYRGIRLREPTPDRGG